MTVVLAIWGILKLAAPTLIPLLLGWLIPSPLKRQVKKEGETHEAVTKAKNSRGDFSDLDDVSH